MIKRGHIFTIPFRVKFIHLIPLPKCKYLGFHENWSLNVPLILYIFMCAYVWGIWFDAVQPNYVSIPPSVRLSKFNETFTVDYTLQNVSKFYMKDLSQNLKLIENELQFCGSAGTILGRIVFIHLQDWLTMKTKLHFH